MKNDWQHGMRRKVRLRMRITSERRCTRLCPRDVFVNAGFRRGEQKVHVQEKKKNDVGNRF